MWNWFKINSVKANPDKLQFMVLEVNNIDSLNLNFVSKIIPFSSEVKLLGITIDNQNRFEKHIKDVWKKASFNLQSLRRIRTYLTVEKARLLSNGFIDIQFNYIQLIWLFAGKILINKVCKSHQRTFSMVCNEYDKSCEEHFYLNHNASIHQRHLDFPWKCLNCLCI